MRVLVYFYFVIFVLVHLSFCIRLPGQNVDKNTLTTLGIKTLGWQDEDGTNSTFSQVHVHHNYSKVSVQNQQVSSYQYSQSQNKFTSQLSNQNAQISSFGQKSVDEDDYFDLTTQNQQTFGGQQKDDLDLDEFSQNGDDQFLVGSSTNSNSGQNQQTNSFGGQEEDDELDLNGFSQTQSNFNQQLQTEDELGSNGNGQIIHQNSKFTNNQASGAYSRNQNNVASQNKNSFNSQTTFQGQQQQKDDYDELSTASSSNNRQIYNAHGYGNTLQLDDIMQAESYLQNQQQFEEFPDYDMGQSQLVDQNAESTNVEQEERQAKKFYTLNQPIYIHGFKYPPDPKDVYPLHQQTPPPEIHTKCPKMATGQFVHSASCNQFLNCWKGRGFVQNCAPGTLFNPKTLECDFASKVQCITGPRKPEETQHTASQKLEISCPEGFSGVVPHHSDCAKFINCANGVEHVMDCPPGTLFSLKINNCDFPYKAECASWSVLFGNIENYSLQSGGSGKFNYGSNNKNYQGQDNFNKHGENNYYQSGNNKNDQKYTSRDDLRYQQGHHGPGSNQGLATGAHVDNFQQNWYGQGSSSTSKNIYEQNVLGTGQGQNGYHGSQQTNQGSGQGFYGAHGNLNQHSQQGSYQQSGQNVNALSSQHSGFGQYQESFSGTQGGNSQQNSFGQGQNYYGENQDLLGSQSQYLHGQNQNLYGQKQEIHGSQGQHIINGGSNLQGQTQSVGQNQQFIGNHGSQNQNFYGQKQDIHETHGSQNQNSFGQQHGNYYGQNQELLGQGQNIYGTNKNQNVGSASSTIFGAVGKAKCPDGTTGLLPHPSDCSKFLNCANGQTFIQDCGPGTVFNPESKVCDFPYKVKCHKSEDYQGLIDVRTEPKPNPSVNVNHQYGHYTSQGSTDQSSSASRWQNREQNQRYGINGNSETSSGVYQDTLDSSESSSKGQNYHSSSGTQKSTEFESEDLTKCPPHASGLYPHPTICSKFLNCANGQTFVQDCGPGTVFNPIHKVCDFSYNVECGTDSDYGEGLIDIKKVPVTNLTEGWYGQGQQHINNQQEGLDGHNQITGATSGGKTQEGYYGQGQSTNLNQQGGQTSNWNGQNENTLTDSATKDQEGFYGQSSITNKQHQSVGYGVNKYDHGQFGSTSTTGQQGFYGQASTTNMQHHGGYGQNQIGSSASGQQEFHGQGSGINKYDHGQTGSTSTAITGQEGLYGQNQIGSSSGSRQQGFYGQGSGANKHYGQSGSTSTVVQNQNTGSTWVNKNQQNSYGESTTTDEDQDLQETKNYNQQFYGSSTTQGQNINKQHHQGHENQGKPHHSPAPFPSTDLNADYEFGNEGVGLEVDFKPKVPKSHSKRKDFCEPSDFHCSVDDCIPQSMVCDGVKDCPSGVDEQNCDRYVGEFELTPNTILAVREKERFLNITLVYCAKICLESKGFQCKSFSYRKDDGACFLSDTNVGHTGALIISHPYNYYEHKMFTVNCNNLYKCPNQKCINFKQVCDGINDCGDRTDEKGCSAEAFGYQIKLSGTDKKHEGRIELKAFGKWGYVCDDKFGLRDADVVCRELGFPLGSLEVKANSYYAQEINEKDVFYLMDDVSCLGNETTIRDCDFNGWGVNNCEPQEVVGIVCKTPLANCPKDHWKCDSAQECIPFTFMCDGVFDCEDQSDEHDQHCEAPIELRLANGKSKYEGRLEIRYHGIWGTVCDDDFNDDSAKVVCKHLGYPGRATAIKDGYFGAGDGPIWLDQVFCQGNESALEHCVHWNWGEHNCEHAEDVGIICSNTYDDLGNERNVKLDQRQKKNEALPEYLFPERCGLRKDDQFLENDDVHFRVIKGSGARKGDYPWQAGLRIKNKSKPTHWCGAVVISQKFVLTAAHCLVGFAKGAYFIVAGDYNTDDDEGTEQEAYIEEFYIHEDFRKGQKMNNDIALVKLKGEGLTFTRDVQPICLPDADLEYDKGLNCTISGFGTIESGKSGYSHQLRAGWVPLQSRDVCQMPHVYGSTITEGMICAGSLDEGTDACDGDSGGPLACLHDGLFTLYGLTSWGHHCGHANKPGVYVKVTHYRKWIDQTIKKHS